MCIAFADQWALPLSFLFSFAIFAIAQQPSSNTMNDSRPFAGFEVAVGNMQYMKCFGEGKHYNDNTISMLKPAGGLVRSTYASGSCRYSQGFRFIESFFTFFTFGMTPGNSDYENQSSVIGHGENIDGLALVISDSPEFAFQGAPGGYLGIEFPKSSSNQSTYNYSVLAVEFDVFPNPEFGDPLYDHVGIDLNGMNSSHTAMAGFNGVNLSNNHPIFVPMKLSGVGQITATVVYVGGDQPYLSIDIFPDPTSVYDQDLRTPLLNASLDPSKVAFLQSGSEIYVGMSASGRLSDLALAYVSQWDFWINDPSDIPGYDYGGSTPPKIERQWVVTLSVLIPVSLSAMLVLGGVLYLRQSRKRLHKEFEHILQDYRPLKFSLKDLKSATLSFSEDRALGRGGYGTVYKGILSENTIVAVKKFSAKLHQADRDAASSSFVQELKVIGRLRHANLVRLLGWCHEKEELMLVYEFMPNGSLDHYLFSKGQSPSEILSWDRRFQILKGVARALAYLHDEWRQLVVHRDVKVSNVLLDTEFNGRLGDFGLARLYDHKEACNPKTTNVAGTCGYIAPEIFLNPKFTEKSDVYAFGMVALQMVSGRKIYDPALEAEDQELLEWIHFMLNCGKIMDVVDGRLGDTFKSKQALDVLQIGLCCTNSDPNPRPRMRQILEMLEGEASIPPVQVQSSPPEASFLPISGVDEDDLEETPLRHAEFEISTTFSRVATNSLVR